MRFGPFFHHENWESTISLAGGFVPGLGGTLDLQFAEGVDPRLYIGTTFYLFNWNGQLPAGAHFDQITSLPGFLWDTSQLYSTGNVTLTAVPEPSTLMLSVLAIVLLAAAARKGVNRRPVR
jgi:hypothetical protein